MRKYAPEKSEATFSVFVYSVEEPMGVEEIWYVLIVLKKMENKKSGKSD